MHTNPESYCNRHICQNHQYDSFNRNVQLYFDTKFLLQFLAFLDFSKRFLENAGLKMCVTIIQPSLSCYCWSGLSRRDTSTDRGVDIKINRSLIGQRGFNAFKAKKLIAHEAITSLCASTIQSSKGKERLWRWRCRRRGRQQHSATGLNLWKSVQGTWICNVHRRLSNYSWCASEQKALWTHHRVTKECC